MSFSSVLAIAGLIFSLQSNLALAENDSLDQVMPRVLENYLKIQDALANDKFEQTPAWAVQIAKDAKTIKTSTLGESDLAHFKSLPGKLQAAAKAYAKSKDLNSAREKFKDLSSLVVTWGKIKKPAGVDVVSCSMAHASWLQKKGQIRNPYYGQSMLECGEIEGSAGTPQAHDAGTKDHSH